MLIRHIFYTASKTPKAVLLIMIATYGLEKKPRADALIQNEVVMDDLFVL